MHPFRFDLDGSIPLLQEEDVAGDLRAGVCPESVVGQADRAKQLCPLGYVLSDLRGLLVHGALGGDEGDDAARPDLVKRFGKEVIVDQEIVAVELPVGELIAAEGHIAHSHIEEVPPVCLFKAGDLDMGLRIEMLGDAPGNTSSDSELSWTRPGVHRLRTIVHTEP